MRRRASPVQQWVDSISSYGNATSSSFDRQNSQVPETSGVSLPLNNSTTSSSLLRNNLQQSSNMTASTAIKTSGSPTITMTGPASSDSRQKIFRDLSLQSDSSHCSSVESLLELRKADPEAILLGLGFGSPNSPQKNGTLARIPKRFLQPSRLKGIAINDFLKQQQESSDSLDTASLGFRGLTGSPHVAPSEIVQKIMERLREHESQELESQTNTTSSNEFNSMQQDSRLSVLSPDNRQYLERPRSKSPDMRNKRMIIGQKSFAFGYNGDLIEIKSFDTEENNSEDQSSVATANPEPREISQLERTVDATLMIEKPTDTQGKRLAKQQSFDEDCSRGSLHTGYEDEASASSSSYRKESLERRYSSITVDDSSDSESATLSTKKSADRDILNDGISSSILRRASDSLYAVKLNKNAAISAEERRLSDGTVQARSQGFDRGIGVTEKRKFSDRKPSLKRQANVRDADLMDYENVTDRENSIRCSPSLENIAGDISTEQTPSDECDDVVKIKSEQRFEEGAEEGRKLCCRGDEERCENDECEHEENSVDCCSHTNGTRCWRKKAKKITRKDDKLDGKKLASNRQEMRGVLNSVMSVRMEPGF